MRPTLDPNLNDRALSPSSNRHGRFIVVVAGALLLLPRLSRQIDLELHGRIAALRRGFDRSMRWRSLNVRAAIPRIAYRRCCMTERSTTPEAAQETIRMADVL